MKIHAFSIIKNESDIIEQVLIRALDWCDYIYVFDNGSTDGTWEIVLELSKRHPEIVPYKQDNCSFSDSLRGQIFNFYREKFDKADWCCRLDADEIYADDPRSFLEKVPDSCDIVCAAMFIYYFTEEDLALYAKDPLSYDDSHRPIEVRLRYYQNSEAEIRFFRYRKGLVWKEEDDCLIPSDYKDWPLGLRGEGYSTKIRLKNYRYRSPKQIQKRIDTRRASVEKGDFPQEMPYRWKSLRADCSRNFSFNRWESRVADSSKLDFDNHDDRLIIREELMLDVRSILISYNFIVTPQNFLREMARKAKRLLVRLGLIRREFD